MTNAPADLLGLRSELQTLTGLSPVDVGIVGNGAHQKTGGYHEGKDTLQANGLWAGDYSVRLARDRNGCTLSASAMDVGAGWRQGRRVWLAWNNLLAGALHASDPALAAVRAINYSPNGSARWRIDREQGWRVESSSDTVDIHTHIEWYRDTEGRRQASLDRIAALAQQAITGQTEVSVHSIDDVYNLLARAINGQTQPAPDAPSAIPSWVKEMQTAAAQTAELVAAAKTPTPVTLSADQISELSAQVFAALAGVVPTVEEINAAVDKAVKARLDGATVHTAGT